MTFYKLFISILFSAFVQVSFSKTFTATPTNDILPNPHRGLMVWGTGEGKYPDSLSEKYYPASIYHVYLPWRLIEPTDDNFDWAGIEKTRLDVISKLDPHATFVLRVVADYPDGGASEIDFGYTGREKKRDFPAFFQKIGISSTAYTECDGDGPGITPDWNHPEFAKQTEQLIYALAKEYDNDSRITAIQLGIIGLWGEWHQTGCAHSLHPNDKIKQLIADTYSKAFKHTPLQIRYAGKFAKNKSFGFYEDAFPRLTAICDRDILLCEDGGDWNLEYGMNNLAPNTKNNWMNSPISGETPYFSGLKHPQTGRTIDKKHWQKMWINNEQQKILGLVNDFHFSFLGPAGRHTVEPKDDSERMKMTNLINSLGYRFQLNHITFPDFIEPASCPITVNISQVGSAPSYFDTHLKIDWVNAQGKVAHTLTFIKNLQGLLPSQKDDFTEQHVLNIPDGEYELRAYLSMRQPQEDNPIQLANDKRNPDGKLPLGKVSVKRTSIQKLYSDSFE